MNDPHFSLHPQLEADTFAIADLKLCRLLLANDSNYPWIILVPRRINIKEAHKLKSVDQQQLLKESNASCAVLEKLFTPDKLNIAALGNMVPQLHIHHIARFTTDTVWPAPVWGATKAVPYSEPAASELKNKLIKNINLELSPL